MRLTATDKEILQSIVILIQKDPSAPLTISNLALVMNTSPSRFKMAFQIFTGMPVYRFILSQRMILAEYLLKQDQYNLKLISKKCGYKHTSNFIVAFKRYYGYTPGQYWKLKA